MGSFSKSLKIGFEILNELYIAVGAGIFGMIVLLKHGLETQQTIKCLSVIGITSVSIAYFCQNTKKIEASANKVVVITGCDSGLGFSLAQHTVDMGFTVIAGFLSLESKGSKEIRKICGNSIIQIQLDITDSSSVQAAVKTFEHFFDRNPGHCLHAIINNAGVMVFGEFEWLTERLIKHQLDVNLLGTFKFTKALCPLLRKYKGRIITITSHCSQTTLPGLAVYGATKAALTALSDGIRVELKKYGVNVLTFIPGSFTMQSNIMAKQLEYVQDMHDGFTLDQHNFYSDYFKRYNVYLSFLTSPDTPKKIDDEKMYEVYENTLLDQYPHVVYKHESIRYAFYHLLFKYSPWQLRDFFVTRFMEMPEYHPPLDENDSDDSDLSCI